MRQVLASAAVAAIVTAAAAAEQGAPITRSANKTLTAVPGIKVGHFTLPTRPTGCTVVLAERGVNAGVDVRGGAPATRETDLLDPVDLVQQVHAIVLSGGSAFGLDVAGGVMRYLEEKKIGFQFGGSYVPIVPGASLFDLGVGDGTIRPTADCGYAAAQAASPVPVAEGSVGAGAGATVGKMNGMAGAMKGGIGSAVVVSADGLIVAALVAVNAAGDVVDPATGQVVAGVRGPDNTLLDARRLLRAGPMPPAAQRQNTTLGVVATNATLTKTQTTRVAQMAHDGLARAIYPSHTSGDGDTIFALATGDNSRVTDQSRVGVLAADAVAEAIVRAVREATGVLNIPAVRDLRR